MGRVDDCCGFFSRHKYCWKTFLVLVNLFMVLFCVSSMGGRGEEVSKCNDALFWASTLLSFYYGFFTLRYVIFICFQLAGYCESKQGSKEYYGDVGSIEKRGYWHVSFSFVDTVLLTPLVVWTAHVNNSE